MLVFDPQTTINQMERLERAGEGKRERGTKQ
jgi:hypothetical protein